MSVEVSEQWGRRLSDKSGDIYYLVTGTDQPTTAKSAVAGVAPSTLGSLPLNDIEVREIPALDAYTAVARYQSGAGSGGGEGELPADQFRFDTTGGTEHVSMALQHIHSEQHPDETGPLETFDGAIGVNGETAAGVSIAVPKFGFSIVKYFDDEDITSSYIGDLYRLTGRTNNAGYSVTVDGKTISYNEGELLFMGVTGAKNLSTGYWELTFNFAASPNESALVIADFDPIVKGGWHYVWARMEKREGSSQVLLKPVALHVERVYKEGNFGDLGL